MKQSINQTPDKPRCYSGSYRNNSTLTSRARVSCNEKNPNPDILANSLMRVISRENTTGDMISTGRLVSGGVRSLFEWEILMVGGGGSAVLSAQRTFTTSWTQHGDLILDGVHGTRGFGFVTAKMATGSGCNCPFQGAP